MRTREKAEFFQILHDVADRRGRQVERGELRQGARPDRMAGFEIGIDDEPEHVARARRQFGDRRGRHSMDLGMAGGWGKQRWNRLARSHDAAKTSCGADFRIVYPVVAREAKKSKIGRASWRARVGQSV